MQVDFNQEALTARLSWEKKVVEVPESTEEVVYTVLTYCDDKPDGRKVYR